MGALSDYITDKCLSMPNIIRELKRVCHNDIPYVNDLSTFTTTDIPRELKEYMLHFAEMNLAISHVAYPSILEMHDYCINFIANLWYAPRNEKDNSQFFGISTIGSSEACIMAGVSMLYHWKKRNQHRLHCDIKPNLIVSAAFQVCWKKFADLFDVELRQIPITNTFYTMQVDHIEAAIDDHTIGIVSIFANTQAGLYDDTKAIDDLIEDNNKRFDRKVTIHVDAASGGFFAPFIQPEILFDFRLKNVVSVNASGHKFGLTPPSIGWLVFRSEEYLSESLKNELDYLGGGVLKDVGFNFSKSAMPLAAQYFLFKTLGLSGYEALISSADKVSKYIENEINNIPQLKVLAKGDISTVIYTVDNHCKVDIHKLEEHLRDMYRWQVPTYELPNTGIYIHRVVVRTDFTMEMARNFIDTLKIAIASLDK